MPQRRKRQTGTSSKKTRSAAKNKRSSASVSRRDTTHKTVRRAPHPKQLTAAQRRQRVASFELFRLRRQGLDWADAEKQSGVTRRIAKRLLPRAFFLDDRGQLQVYGYDRYTRTMKIHTTMPGEFRWIRARGSHKGSLVGTWNNAVKAAGHGDFSLIDAFPPNVIIDGFHLTTSHDEVSRIAAAAAESDKPFEDIYDLAGGR